MTPSEIARIAAKEIIEVIIQKAILPIPLTDLDDLEDTMTEIIHDNFTRLSPQTYVPVVLSSTGQNTPPLSLSNVRRPRHGVLVRFALRMLLPQEG